MILPAVWFISLCFVVTEVRILAALAADVAAFVAEVAAALAEPEAAVAFVVAV